MLRLRFDLTMALRSETPSFGAIATSSFPTEKPNRVREPSRLSAGDYAHEKSRPLANIKMDGLVCDTDHRRRRAALPAVTDEKSP